MNYITYVQLNTFFPAQFFNIKIKSYTVHHIKHKLTIESFNLLFHMTSFDLEEKKKREKKIIIKKIFSTVYLNCKTKQKAEIL